MSLILEALRRSEAERRLGEAPGLHAADAWRALPARSGGRERPAWPWWLLALAVTAALAAAAGAWWPRADVAPSAVAPEAATPAEADVAPVDAAPAPDVAAADVAAPAVAPPAGAWPTSPAVAIPSPPVPVAPVAPPPSPPVETMAAAATAAPTPLPSPADATPPVPGASAEDARPPSLAALDPARRAALPPLRLGLHVWDEAPARRRVVIDGERRVEGDWVAADVRLVAIVRGGCILEIDGRRWWLGVA